MNYAWFESGYTHNMVSEETWRGMQQHCNFAADLGVDGNGCPAQQSQQCKDLIDQWQEEIGTTQGLLELYDYYAPVCNVSVTHVGPALDDPCLDKGMEHYLNK